MVVKGVRLTFLVWILLRILSLAIILISHYLCHVNLGLLNSLHGRRKEEGGRRKEEGGKGRHRTDVSRVGAAIIFLDRRVQGRRPTSWMHLLSGCIYYPVRLKDRCNEEDKDAHDGSSDAMIRALRPRAHTRTCFISGVRFLNFEIPALKVAMTSSISSARQHKPQTLACT